MSTYPRAATQSKAVAFPVTTFAPKTTAKRDSVWRSTLLQCFDAIHLSEMDHVALLRRTDTKYLMSEEQLSQALAHLTDHYRILEVNGRRLQRYQTLYFDTPDLALYRQHHNDWRNRYKVRERAYVDSDLAFWRSSTRSMPTQPSRAVCELEDGARRSHGIPSPSYTHTIHTR